jgi:hypothetical protein
MRHTHKVCIFYFMQQIQIMFLGCLSCFANTIKRKGNRKEKEKEKENDIGPMGGPIYYERGYFLPFYL